MKFNAHLGGLALGLLLTTSFVVATPAVAGSPATSNTPSDTEISGILQRIADGTWNSTDLSRLRLRPDVAAQVPDPSTPPVLAATGGDGATASASKGIVSADALSATAIICGAWADVWYGKTSSLGNTIFQWHHRVTYCRNGSQVTSWQERYDYMGDHQSGVEMGDLTAVSQSGIGTSSASSFRQREVIYCVFKFGCYEWHYPYSTITVHGNGTYSFTGSSN
jgi:hypothetical protein